MSHDHMESRCGSLIAAESMPGRVTAADVEQAVRTAVAMLTDAFTADWSLPAGELEWDCWETLEHMADGLFA